MTTQLHRFTLCTLLLTGALAARAQWVSQSFALKAGWNAVYLHVDASYDTLENLVAADSGNPILEIWRWSPAVSTAQFITSPQEPTSDNAQWTSWARAASADSQLQRLIGNNTYLVRIPSNVASYAWSVKGKPLAPAYEWTTSGLNFLGFPSVTGTPPTFDTFLSKCTALQGAEIYYYPGGDLGTGNPARLYATRTYKVTRGQAFWLRAGTTYNRYFAPFEISLTGSGVDFGSQGSTASLRLRNLTSGALTVSLQLAASEAPPSGQTPIAATPPLLVRGAQNLTNLTYGCTALSVGASRTWALTAAGLSGSEAEIVLGLNRSAVTNGAGALLAGVLRLTDSLGHSRIDLPVAATVGAKSGLWVGEARVSQVGQYLVSYAHGSASPLIVTNGTSVTTNNLTVSSNGTYVVSNVNTNLGAVPAAYPLRLIVHNPASGPAVLLQQVYCGRDAATNSIVATAQSALDPAQFASARRISAIHLPWSAANAGWPFSGNLADNTLLAVTVADSYKDRASNPFLHGYHPDHDDLDSSFVNELPQGSESYTIQRELTLAPTTPASDFASLTAGNQTLSGVYLETVRLLGLARGVATTDQRTFRAAGTFILHRISETPVLTTP